MAPGEVETQRHVPFVGPAGRVLADTLAEIGWDLPSYFLNLVLCRTRDGKKNRDPKPDEIDSCQERLWDQIQILAPKAIIRLGRLVSQEAPDFELPTWDCWHPSYPLRDKRRRPAYTEQMRFVLNQIRNLP